MQADEIAGFLLPQLLNRERGRQSGFVLREIANTIADRGNDNPHGIGRDEYASLIVEGLGFLDRSGMLINNPEQSSGLFFRLSRAGRKAAETESPMFGTVAGLEARKLLHPVIAEAALGNFERGDYDAAVTAAFKRIEVEANRRSGLLEHGKDSFYKAMGENAPLTPPPLDKAEAQSLRETFAGCYGAFRNPASHRDVNEIRSRPCAC